MKSNNNASLFENDVPDAGCSLDKVSEEIKMLEINEAIHDLDAKLTDLEMALKMDNSATNKK